MFVVTIIILVGLLVLLGVRGNASSREKAARAAGKDNRADDAKFTKVLTGWISVGVAVALAISTFLSTTYTQDPGQAVVQKSWTGNVVGQTTAEGLQFKAPWVDAIYYDIRNQQVVFGQKATDSDHGNNGSQITVQDREGVTANIDISLRYSIDPGSVTEIYRKYQSQENFVSRFIENDIRAAVRTVPAEYGTLELLNKRAEVEEKIHNYLVERWAEQGVRVDTVSLQEIRYSEEVQQRFADAQNARTEVEKAKAELEATEVSAQQKIVQAEAEAKANEVLTKSLTPEVLQQRYLDTLKELAKAGNLVITDGNNANVLIQK